jgi:hypothetical protein
VKVAATFTRSLGSLASRLSETFEASHFIPKAGNILEMRKYLEAVEKSNEVSSGLQLTDFW